MWNAGACPSCDSSDGTRVSIFSRSARRKRKPYSGGGSDREMTVTVAPRAESSRAAASPMPCEPSHEELRSLGEYRIGDSDGFVVTRKARGVLTRCSAASEPRQELAF